MVAKVSVILSSFNGARYLPEQLDSLLGQSYSNLWIQVRDDGSCAATRAILESYAAQHANIGVSFGERLGIVNSFFHLLTHANDTSEYFALCDQDDVWYPDKVERAVSKLSAVDRGVPALYCSRQEYVNHHLDHLGYSRVPPRAPLFQNALVENIATGCSVVLNRAARDMIVSQLPRRCIMHDWWCYLVVAAFGTVIYDAYPGVKYRLHGANDTGAAVSLREDFVRRVQRFLRGRDDVFRIHAQAQEFACIYQDALPADKREGLDRFLASKRSAITRLLFAMNPSVYRQSRFDDVLLRMLITLNWY